MSAETTPEGLFDPALLTGPDRRVPLPPPAAAALAALQRTSTTPLHGAALIQGDALHLPLADESVDLVITSPPYFGLRAYTDGGETYTGQLGSEPTPAEFLQALWAATAEMKRVLKPGGSIFVNLGDAYYSGKGEPTQPDEKSPARRPGKRALDGPMFGVQRKSLTLLPEAYRLGCTGMLAQLGGADPGLNLIARSVIVWDKPNSLPESVKDRVRRSHEDWVHLVKQPRYYSAVDEIREPHSANTAWKDPGRYDTAYGPEASPFSRTSGNPASGLRPSRNPLGKLPGSVWSIPSEPFRAPTELGVDHYAGFPSEWPRRLILGFSPPGICTGCNEGRVPVVDKQTQESPRPGLVTALTNGHGADGREGARHSSSAQILGYACACTPYTDHPGTGGSSGPDGRYGNALGRGEGYPATFQNSPAGGNAHLGNRPRVGGWREYHLDGWTPPPTRPAVILDPFCGTGTTIAVARALGRYGIGVDLSADYLRLARWRITAGGAAAKAISRTNAERQGTL